MYAEIGKLILEIIKEVRSALKDRKSLSLIQLGTLLELYGCATRLKVYATQVENVLSHDRLSYTKDELFSLDIFLKEISKFSILLGEMNLNLLDIYYPQLVSDLVDLINSDLGTLTYLERKVSEGYNLEKHDVEKIIYQLERYLPFYQNPLFSKNQYGQFRIKAERLSSEDHQKLIEWFVNQLTRAELYNLADSALKFQKTLGEIIQENWEFRELVQSDEISPSSRRKNE